MIVLWKDARINAVLSYQDNTIVDHMGTYYVVHSPSISLSLFDVLSVFLYVVTCH